MSHLRRVGLLLNGHFDSPSHITADVGQPKAECQIFFDPLKKHLCSQHPALVTLLKWVSTKRCPILNEFSSDEPSWASLQSESVKNMVSNSHMYQVLNSQRHAFCRPLHFGAVRCQQKERLAEALDPDLWRSELEKILWVVASSADEMM